jgi:ubiquinone biosynthesis monooxygenase Coq7
MNQNPPNIRRLSPLDRLLSVASRALADATTAPAATRPLPVPSSASRLKTSAGEPALDEASRRHAAGLMRVNHVGEVCAQALYEGHALTVGDDQLAAFFLAAADEERDHLAWTHQRLQELQASPSLLIPLWYLGSISLGSLAGYAGPRWALGFMAETERQVEAHLDGHLERLPEADTRSRAIVEQMKADEARHGKEAMLKGGAAIPGPIRGLMKFTSRIMTTVAYRI